MAGKWDSIIKRLVGVRPEQYTRWLMDQAVLVQALNIELQTQHFFADALLKVSIGGQYALLHIEFQTFEDPDMGKRMLEYSVLAEHQYALPVNSFAIYLRKHQVAKTPYIRRFIDGQFVHHFHFRVVKLWEMPAQVLLDTGWDGLLPLLPLTKGGKKPQFVQTMVDRLATSGERDLLVMAEMFGGLMFTGVGEKAWFKRRFTMHQDILRDSWVYQELAQMYAEQGLQQGLQQGREQEHKASLQTQRQLIIDLVTKRFPLCTELATQQVAKIVSLSELGILLVDIASAHDSDEVSKLLVDAVKE